MLRFICTGQVEGGPFEIELSDFWLLFIWGRKLCVWVERQWTIMAIAKILVYVVYM